ncbi:MAG: ORF6N domain-containing protein [Oscillospiraceae bacterium]|nr:ORF6N domain-containing protein [Oscillospiraceae bacterium]
MDNELESVGIESIKNLIYTIRGKQVMLDSDVAMLYKYETRIMNQTVKRNIKRFPERFCFRLTQNEYEEILLRKTTMSSQIVTTSTYKYRRTSHLPYVFTEQGISMLSPLLNSEIAIQVSINIMDAFVDMRRFIMSNAPILERLTNVEYKLLEHDKNFDKLFNELQKEDENFKQKIFFEGQIYDAYSLIIDIIKKANNKIVIIDSYIDDSVLKMLTKKNKGVEVVILTSNMSNISKLDVQKFNKEYPTLKVAKTDKFHDRFIIIDGNELYHCGASIKDLGKKCFGINKIVDKNMIDNIIGYCV